MTAPRADIKAASICVSTPCPLCPFRHDVVPYIRAERVQEIWDAAQRGTHFVCHETVDYDLPDGAQDPGRRACAGFMVLAHREGIAHGLTIVQVAERLTGHRFDALRGAATVYATVAAMVEAHRCRS